MRDVLRRERFCKYFSVEDAEILVAKLTGNAAWVEPEKHIEVGRDPKDDMFLEVAVSGKATYIVSGDRDLLVLGPCENIRMVTPRDSLDLSSELQS
jgi:putative PIN family toxin of toxin-antitoxin system